MAEFERQNYVPPYEKLPNEVRLPADIFEKFQDFSSENKHSVLDNYVMGQSVLEMSDIVSTLHEFTLDHFSFIQGNENKISPFYYYKFFQTHNHKTNMSEMNVMNSIDLSIVDRSSNQAFCFGFGIINMKIFGGYVVGKEGSEIPEDDHITEHVLERGIHLNFANQNSFFLDDSLLGEIQEYAAFFLEEAYESYWEELSGRSLASTKMKRKNQILYKI